MAACPASQVPHSCAMCMAFTREQSTFPPAGRAHCAMPILGAKNVGQVGQVGQVGRLAQGAECAMRSGIFKAHGSQVAIDHLQYSRYSQYSWFLCPHPVHCAMCFASLPEARERSESRLHDCGATRLFHFALHAKMKKRDICFENEEVQKGNAKTCLHSGKIECLHSNTGGFKAHILQGPEAREPDRATADCMPAGATRLQMCRTKNSKSVYIQHTVF